MTSRRLLWSRREDNHQLLLLFFRSSFEGVKGPLELRDQFQKCD